MDNKNRIVQCRECNKWINRYECRKHYSKVHIGITFDFKNSYTEINHNEEFIIHRIRSLEDTVAGPVVTIAYLLKGEEESEKEKDKKKKEKKEKVKTQSFKVPLRWVVTEEKIIKRIETVSKKDPNQPSTQIALLFKNFMEIWSSLPTEDYFCVLCQDDHGHNVEKVVFVHRGAPDSKYQPCGGILGGHFACAASFDNPHMRIDTCVVCTKKGRYI